MAMIPREALDPTAAVFSDAMTVVLLILAAAIACDELRKRAGGGR